MPITRLKVSNFKSFADLEVSLGPLNVLVGANAAGKSNLAQVFRFLADASAHGLEDAISMQGGIEYLANLRIGASRPITLTLAEESPFQLRGAEQVLLGFTDRTYTIRLQLTEETPGYKVLEESYVLNFKLLQGTRLPGEASEEQELGDGSFHLWKENGSLRQRLDLPPGFNLPELPFFFSSDVWQRPFGANALILQHPFIVRSPFEPLFANAVVYDFDPKLPKKAVAITGRAELEPDGSNLAVVLRNINSDPEKRRRFFNLLRELLPFASGLKATPVLDKSLLFMLEENYLPGKYLPSSLLSDGTISITALVAALYFEVRPLKIVEEPERNMHPGLIGRVVEMMLDSSRAGQLIVTTQNAEIVKRVPLGDLLLVSRGRNGFSSLVRPAENKHLVEFLKGDIGVDDLFVQGLLTA